MIDALTGSMTVFDLAVFVVVILSALMGLSRGFMRELATIAALFFASIAAYFGRIYFKDTVASWMPGETPDIYADLIIIGLAFTITYLIVRVIGVHLAKLVQGVDSIGTVDRLTGLVFGVARGLALPFLTAWLILNVAPTEAVPEFISKSVTYPIFERAAAAIDIDAATIAEKTDQYFEPTDTAAPDE